MWALHWNLFFRIQVRSAGWFDLAEWEHAQQTEEQLHIEGKAETQVFFFKGIAHFWIIS